MSSIGKFKAQSKVGVFQWENSAYAGELRRKVEKFAARNISNQAWSNYAELRALRELARNMDETLHFDSLAVRKDHETREQQEYDKLWDEFYDSSNPDGSSKFALALVVERMVLRVDPWA
jgi:hypothetical protein